MENCPKPPHPLQNIIGPFPDEGFLSLLDQFLVKLGLDRFILDKLMVCSPIKCCDLPPPKCCECSSTTSLKVCPEKKVQISLQKNPCPKPPKCQCCKCQPKLCDSKCYCCRNLIPTETAIKCEVKCPKPCLKKCPKKTECPKPECALRCCCSALKSSSKKCGSSCIEKITSILKSKPKCEEVCEEECEVITTKCPCKLRPVRSQWALTKVNIFNDNSKTFEIMDMQSAPPPCLVKENPKMLLALTRNGTAYVFDGIN